MVTKKYFKVIVLFFSKKKRHKAQYMFHTSIIKEVYYIIVILFSGYQVKFGKVLNFPLPRKYNRASCLSDSSGADLNHRQGMIALQRMGHSHRDPALSEIEVKSEPNTGLPDPSILPSKYYEDEDDVMSETDSDEHSSSSEKKKRPGRKKGQSKF